MDNLKLAKLRKAVEQALDTVGEAHKVAFEVEEFKYRNGSTKCTLRVQPLDESGAVVDTAKLEFELYAPMLGLAASDYGRKFVYRGAAYTVCGAAPKSTKYSVLARSERGAIYKFMPATLKACWRVGKNADATA